MYCSKCGSEVKEGSKFCGVCGMPTGSAQNSQPVNQVPPNPFTHDQKPAYDGNYAQPNAGQKKPWLTVDAKCIPAFVLGLIGGILGIMGGYCTTALSLYDGGNASFIMIFVPSIIGLVGGCLCYKRAHLGSVLMFIPGVTILIKGWFMYGGAGFMSIFAMLLFWIGGIVGLVMTRQSR